MAPGTSSRTPIRVLLVEDNPGDARLVELLLGEAASSITFELTHVVRLEEAFERLETEEFDVVLLDLSLPDASGLDTVGAMQNAAPHLPVVVLSGMADEEVALRAIGGGAEDYLIKGQGDGILIARSIRYAIERKKAEERLAYLSQYDPMTGLANRVLFQDRLRQAMARAERDGSMVALIFLNLDRFKSFNDAFGHHFGDELLKVVAGRLEDRAREGDTVARLGSDEFGIILEDLSEAQAAAQVARGISEKLSEPVALGGQEVFVTASMGIAVRPPSGADSVMKDANAALQRAKELGRANYQFFSPEMNVQAFERLAFESSLRRALERGEFHIHYQPQVELASGRIVGAEALLRWYHPDLGLISPAKFIPVLEDTGLIVPVGEWLIEETCREARAWRDAGLPAPRVAVNLSPRQFRSRNLAHVISAALTRENLEPFCLELEITESLLMEDTEESDARLNALKAERGLRVAIDDFGTGYSSLAYLKRFPIDVLKVDRSFVRGMDGDPDAAAIISAIIGLAHNLRLKVIAEGVETAAQLARLRELDCDQAQGFYFSRPLPAGDFARLLGEGNSFAGARVAR